MVKKAIVNAHVFDGETLLENYTVVHDAGNVIELIAGNEPINNIEVQNDLQGNYLTPGFIDLQVNGGGGAMFNNVTTVEAIRTIGAAHRKYGTTGFLPTLITDSFEVMRQAVKAVTEAIEEGVPGVLGIHLEGPFLNTEKKGVHDAEKFCLIDEEGFEIITSLAKGKTLITIAPELTSAEMIERIVAKGVVIAAGHTNANYDQTREALNAGVTGFTHLYNAMTALQSREPGVVGAALEDTKSWFGIIADGYHMHPAAFSIAIRAKQSGGAVLVTDAMSTVGAENKSFVLDGETIEAIDGKLVSAAGALAGSDLDMITAVKNAVEFAKIDWTEAVRMASLYPAQALGIQDRYGYIKPGYKADFVAFDKDFKVTKTWIDGVISE